MAKPLTEKRKADRQKLAQAVKDLCDARSASCTVTDYATHIYADGSRSIADRRIGCAITFGPVRVGVDFDGDSHANVDHYCLPWNMAHDSDARFSSAFGAAMRASVNPYHRRKCTAFAHGLDDLLSQLRTAFEMIADGEAFETD